MLSRVLRVSSRIARRPMAARALSSLAARTGAVRAAAAAPAAATKAARAVAVAGAAPARGMAAGAPIYSSVPMVQQQAPAWKADAVVNGEFKTLSSADYKGKYVVLFFYPLDWTFVCPTEIIAFSERAADFRKIGCEVVGVSVDSKFSHLAWINTARKDGGLGKMDIPLVADICKQMSQDYGVLLPSGIALRGLFIIDPTGTVRIAQVNDLPIGRSVDETLRLVKALQFHAKHGEVCPADWKEGAPTMKDNPKDSKAYFSKVHKH